MNVKSLFVFASMVLLTFAGSVHIVDAASKQPIKLNLYQTDSNGGQAWTNVQVNYFSDENVTCFMVPDRWTLSCLSGRLSRPTAPVLSPVAVDGFI